MPTAKKAKHRRKETTADAATDTSHLPNKIVRRRTGRTASSLMEPLVISPATMSLTRMTMRSGTKVCWLRL